MAQAQDYQRMGIKRLRELARQQHPEHTDEASRAFVARILDLEVERRTWHEHENIGWHTHSPGAPGFAPGGTDIAREPLALAYDRGIRAHDAHEYARRFIAWVNVSPRQLLAVLIQAAKCDRRTTGPWSKSYEQIVADLGPYAQRLGWPPGFGVEVFKDAKALTNAATRARAQLILLAKL